MELENLARCLNPKFVNDSIKSKLSKQSKGK